MNLHTVLSTKTTYTTANIENLVRPSHDYDAHHRNNIVRIQGASTAKTLATEEGKQQGAVKNELKIVVAGNVGSGKTTSINAVSEVPVIGTESKATERDALHRKQTTTTAMEYGIVHVANTKLHLYGTPGQRRFDFMADILCKGASGMVVMIDNGCDNPLMEIDYYLNQHGNFLKKFPGIIAITHFDDNNTRTSLLDYHTYILSNGFTCPVMLVDARKKDEVQKLLMRLLLQITDRKTGKQAIA